MRPEPLATPARHPSSRQALSHTLILPVLSVPLDCWAHRRSCTLLVPDHLHSELPTKPALPSVSAGPRHTVSPGKVAPSLAITTCNAMAQTFQIQICTCLPAFTFLVVLAVAFYCFLADLMNTSCFQIALWL